MIKVIHFLNKVREVFPFAREEEDDVVAAAGGTVEGGVMQA